MTIPAIADPQAVANILAQQYLRLDSLLREALTRATLAGMAGEWSRKRSEALLAQVQAELSRLGVVLDQAEPQQLALAFQQGAQGAAAQLATQLPAGDPRLGVDFNRLNTGAVESLARDLAGQRGLFLGTVGTYPGSVLRQVDDYLRKLMSGELLASVGLGQGSRATGARIRDAAIDAVRQSRVGAGGEKLAQEAAVRKLSAAIDRTCGVTYFDKDGNPTATHSMHFYGQMAARTGQARALEEGNVAWQKEAGVELFKISTHGTLCHICRPWEGVTFRYEWATSPGAMRYPLCPREIPFHPQCQHSRVPVAFAGDEPIPSKAQMALFNSDDRELYAHMRDEIPGGARLMKAARNGFATQAQWNEYRRMAKNAGIPEGDLRGPRWRYAGIEGRRKAAIAEMINNPELTYEQAMGAQTRDFLRSVDYAAQRPGMTPAAQLEAVQQMRAR